MRPVFEYDEDQAQVADVVDRWAPSVGASFLAGAGGKEARSWMDRSESRRP